MGQKDTLQSAVALVGGGQDPRSLGPNSEGLHQYTQAHEAWDSPATQEQFKHFL
jgi:hypothetical protein